MLSPRTKGKGEWGPSQGVWTGSGAQGFLLGKGRMLGGWASDVHGTC